jgi:glycosyltransferase involved in cell wall biosynthesis
MRIERVAVLALRNPGGQVGGAEVFYHGLAAALRATGLTADLIEVPGDESSFEAIEETYLRCYDLDVSHYDAVISTKAPTFLVRHPNHICYLLHTIRVFYDMFDQEYAPASPTQLQQRATVHRLDTAALQPARTRKIFAIGYEVAARLLHWNHLHGEVLHPGLRSAPFRTGPYGDYLFLPGRLHRWKRVHLVIKALRYVRHPVRLVIVGVGEDAGLFEELRAGDERRGRVSEDELIDLYAGALAVPFVPVREDYGYVTLEAFRSAKPVITCHDSGEPSRLVRHKASGVLCRPDPEEIGAAISHLYEHRDEARRLGEQGYADTRHICWSTSVAKVLAALEASGEGGN